MPNINQLILKNYKVPGTVYGTIGNIVNIGNKIKSPENNAKARKTVFDVIGGTINKIFNKK